MPSAIVSISALLLGASMLLWGNGLQGILLPVRATIEAFSTSTIGLIASGYSIGFVISCRYAPHIVRRVGHIRSFAVLASIGACVVLLFVLVVHPLMWIALRMLSGFCFAGLYMVIESWLNESAENSNRGQIFSTYMVINLTAITLGQLVLPLGDPAGFELFAVTAIAVRGAVRSRRNRYPPCSSGVAAPTKRSPWNAAPSALLPRNPIAPGETSHFQLSTGST